MLLNYNSKTPKPPFPVGSLLGSEPPFLVEVPFWCWLLQRSNTFYLDSVHMVSRRALTLPCLGSIRRGFSPRARLSGFGSEQFLQAANTLVWSHPECSTTPPVSKYVPKNSPQLGLQLVLSLRIMVLLPISLYHEGPISLKMI